METKGVMRMQQSGWTKLALAFALAGTVSAGAHGVRLGTEAFDANDDGTITPAEIDAASVEWVADLQEKFLERYDSVPTGAIEGDGLVTSDEAKAVFAEDSAEWLEKTLAQFDPDGDGKIVATDTPKRGRKVGAAFVEKYDANDDGTVTKEELTSAADARTAERLADFLEKYDSVPEGQTVGDGQITEAESVSVHTDHVADLVESWLERVDANDDGTVTSEELAAVAKPRGKGDGARGPGGRR